MSNDIPQDPGIWLPRAQYDALMVAAKVLMILHTFFDFECSIEEPIEFADYTEINKASGIAWEAINALRAAGVEMGEATGTAYE